MVIYCTVDKNDTLLTFSKYKFKDNVNTVIEIEVNDDFQLDHPPHYYKIENNKIILRENILDKVLKEQIEYKKSMDIVPRVSGLEITAVEQDFSIFMNQMDTMHLENTTEVQDFTLSELQIVIMNLELQIMELKNNLGGN